MGDFRTAPFIAKLAGYPLSLKHSTHMISITPHNDFLRIMFFTGYAGLIFYLFLLYKVFWRVKYNDVPERFFIYAILVSTILYSITTVPTFYPGYVNILMITFAYSALPRLKPVRNVAAKNNNFR
jgi:O-antigen ligase